MPEKRAQINLPDDLLADIDTLVGQRDRSAFLVEVLREEVRRRRLLQILDNPEPVWKDDDHPELVNGAEAWVRELREKDLCLERDKLGGWLGRGEDK